MTSSVGLADALKVNLFFSLLYSTHNVTSFVWQLASVSAPVTTDHSLQLVVPNNNSTISIAIIDSVKSTVTTNENSHGVSTWYKRERTSWIARQPASQPVPLYTDISTMYTYMKHKRVLYVYTLTPLPLSINNTTSATGAYYTWQTSPLHQPPEYLQKSKSRSLVWDIMYKARGPKAAARGAITICHVIYTLPTLL